MPGDRRQRFLSFWRWGEVDGQDSTVARSVEVGLLRETVRHAHEGRRRRSRALILAPGHTASPIQLPEWRPSDTWTDRPQKNSLRERMEFIGSRERGKGKGRKTAQKSGSGACRGHSRCDHKRSVIALAMWPISRAISPNVDSGRTWENPYGGPSKDDGWRLRSPRLHPGERERRFDLDWTIFGAAVALGCLTSQERQATSGKRGDGRRGVEQTVRFGPLANGRSRRSVWRATMATPAAGRPLQATRPAASSSSTHVGRSASRQPVRPQCLGGRYDIDEGTFPGNKRRLAGNHQL